MNVNERARFEQLAKLNEDLAIRTGCPDIRAVHEAWALFYKGLAGASA